MSQNELVAPRVNGKLAVPDPEVRPKAKHRRFSAEYKKRILEEAEACREHGQLGALLRREGLYSSHLTTWRRQRERMVLEGLAPKKRGPKPDPLAAENTALKREIERLELLRHPVYAKPELLATQPNKLWSWDITKLRGPSTWSYHYLYVMLDVYSRCVVGWLLAEHESEELAKQLIDETCAKQGILSGQPQIHADNGSPMISKSVAQLLVDLGVTKSHSRPHVSDDNPFSEAQFKTLKYRPDYPERFGCLADARAWAQMFFTWYNHEHHHTGMALLTPASVHYGQAPAIVAKWGQTLQAAYTAHPERFVKGPPTPSALPKEVWINRPQPVLELPEQRTVCAAEGSTAPFFPSVRSTSRGRRGSQILSNATVDYA